MQTGPPIVQTDPKKHDPTNGLMDERGKQLPITGTIFRPHESSVTVSESKWTFHLLVDNETTEIHQVPPS